MLRKLVICALCACLGFSLHACSNSSQKPADDTQKPQEAQDSRGEADDTQPKPLLDSDATDEELLEVLGDEINVVTDEDYVEMVTEFQEHTEKYEGKIYQLEGFYTTENGTPCIARTVVDGSQKASSSMPLKYLPQEPEEDAWILVTGIVNESELNGKAMPLLEVIVAETLDEQGKAELPAP